MNRSLSFPQALGALGVAAMAWGGMLPLAKALMLHMDVFVMTAIRYGLAAPLFLLALAWKEGRPALRLDGRGWQLAALGSLGFAGFNLLGYEGLRYTQPQQAAIIIALMPLLSALVNWALNGARPSAGTWASIGLSLLGVALVLSNGNPAHLLADNHLGGDGLVLLGVLCWVIYTLTARGYPAWSSLRYTAWTCTFGALSIVGIAVLAVALGRADLPTLPVLRESAWGLAYRVLIAAFIAVLGWNAGIQRVGASVGVLFINFVPVTAFGIALFQGVHFGRAEMLGAGLVMLALLFNSALAHPRVKTLLSRGQTVHTRTQEA